jgi:hypothetical protein
MAGRQIVVLQDSSGNRDVDSEPGRTQDRSVLSPEERLVLEYLATSPKTFFSAREVCRRAGDKEMYSQNPNWAVSILNRLLQRGLVEVDPTGRYRILRRDEG